MSIGGADDGHRWWDDVVAWVRDQATAVPGAADAHVLREEANIRTWGITAPVVAGTSRLWFKATEPERAFEVPVTAFVAHGWPLLAPAVHAIDEGRRWMLLGHHGGVIDALPVVDQVTAIESLLGPYGDLQRSTAGVVERWIGAGVPDRRVGGLPERVETVLSGVSIDVGLATRCRELLPRLHTVCDALVDRGAADALEHADVHGWNVVTIDGGDGGDRGGGGPRLIDWGDCCVTHPFTALFVPTRFVVERLPIADRGAAGRRLRDAYLEAWGGPTREHLRTLELAQWVAPLVRVLALAAEADGGDEIRWLLEGWVADAPPGI